MRGRSFLRTRSAVCVLGACAAGALVACSGSSAEEAPTTPAGPAAVGDPAPSHGLPVDPEPPDVRIATLADLEAELEARKGSGFLLNFWAIWCAPCVAELPALESTAKAWRPKGGDVLTVSYDLMAGGTAKDAETNVRAFLEKRGFTFDALIFDEDDYDGINALLDLPGDIPVTLAIDAGGTVVDREDEAAGAERFDAMMRKALGEE